MGKLGKIDEGSGKHVVVDAVEDMDVMPPRVRAVEVITALLEAAKQRGGKVTVLVVNLLRTAEVKAAVGDNTGRLLLPVVQEDVATTLDQACFVHRLDEDSIVIAAPPDSACQQEVILTLAGLAVPSRPFTVNGARVSVLHRVGGTSARAGEIGAEELLARAEAVARESMPGPEHPRRSFRTVSHPA